MSANAQVVFSGLESKVASFLGLQIRDDFFVNSSIGYVRVDRAMVLEYFTLKKTHHDRWWIIRREGEALYIG